MTNVNVVNTEVETEVETKEVEQDTPVVQILTATEVEKTEEDRVTVKDAFKQLGSAFAQTGKSIATSKPVKTGAKIVIGAGVLIGIGVIAKKLLDAGDTAGMAYVDAEYEDFKQNFDSEEDRSHSETQETYINVEPETEDVEKEETVEN